MSTTAGRNSQPYDWTIFLQIIWWMLRIILIIDILNFLFAWNKRGKFLKKKGGWKTVFLTIARVPANRNALIELRNFVFFGEGMCAGCDAPAGEAFTSVSLCDHCSEHNL